MAKKEDKIRQIISFGAEIVGSSLSEAALGYLLGGPEGALVGLANGALKRGIKKTTQVIIADVASRFLSQREKLRIGASVTYSINKVDFYLSQGLAPREDFFGSVPRKRAKAEELLEGILIDCKQEYEESKIKYISNIFANVIFDTEISLSEANFRLSLAEGMTYRQFCILSLFLNKERKGIILNNNDYMKGVSSLELRSILLEIYDLYNRGLIESYEADKGLAYNLSGILTINPNKLRLTKHGTRQSQFMSFEDMSDSEYNDIMNQLTTNY